MTQGLLNGLEFSAIGGCKANAANIAVIVAAASSALKPTD
jgi:hypothetical protein